MSVDFSFLLSRRFFVLIVKMAEKGKPQAVLSAEGELIADEMIHRKQFDEIPPRVEYCLTEKGNSVVPILRSICGWAGIYQNEDSELSLPQCKKYNYRGGKLE